MGPAVLHSFHAFAPEHKSAAQGQVWSREGVKRMTISPGYFRTLLAKPDDISNPNSRQTELHASLQAIQPQ